MHPFPLPIKATPHPAKTTFTIMDGESSPSPPAAGLTAPAGMTAAEQAFLLPTITAHHRYHVGPGQCSSILFQRIHAPPAAVWAVVRRFDRPQTYKHFIRSCSIVGSDPIRVGTLREVIVVSGLPANTSTERLDIMDEERRVMGFSITGGEHRLQNYRSVTTVSELRDEGGFVCSYVLESYVVDVPEGNSEEDTRLFADTVIRLNLQKLAAITERAAAAAAPEV